MGAQENIATVQRMYEAFGAGDVDTILDELGSSVEWGAAAAEDIAPWYGKRTNRDEVAKFFADLGGAMDVQEFTPRSFAANDNDEVFVLIKFRYTIKDTGKSADMDLFHYWRFSDGKVAVFLGSEDTAQTEAALAA
jgi:uncharacterized protein